MTGAELGRTCALAVECGRELSAHAQRYGELFPPKPFDAGFFHSLALVAAFGSPWATPEQLRALNRASLWVFAVDFRIDHAAESREEVAGVVAECLAGARGSPLTRYLADLREAASDAPDWRDQLGRMLNAMAREWDWRAGGPPDLDGYLANADSTGSSFVNLSHWLATGDAWTLDHLDEVRTASDAVQRYLRLLNDLATYGREAQHGDVNAVTLGGSRTGIVKCMSELAERAAVLTEPLRRRSPRTALYLERQVEFNTGFYGLADYWGDV